MPGVTLASFRRCNSAAPPSIIARRCHEQPFRRRKETHGGKRNPPHAMEADDVERNEYLGGDDRIRTGDQDFADPCLATWPRRRIERRNIPSPPANALDSRRTLLAEYTATACVASSEREDGDTIQARGCESHISCVHFCSAKCLDGSVLFSGFMRRLSSHGAPRISHNVPP